MAAIDPIKVTNLDRFVKDLKTIDKELPKAVRVAGNRAVQIIINWAKPKIPKQSGKAANSVRAASTQKAARIKSGGSKAPYYPWLDFGGRVGKNKSVERKFYSDGRYLYPGLTANRDEIRQTYEDSLIELVEKYMEVSGG